MKADDDAGLRASLELIQRLVQDPLAPDAVARDARTWLEAAGLSRDDAAALASVLPKRLLLYRKLVRRGVASAIRAELPRTAARLGAAFDEWVQRFFDEELPRSHYLRDVAFEWLGWAATRWSGDPRVPPWTVDLARHELVEFEVRAAHGAEAVAGRSVPGAVAPRAVVAEPGHELDLDRGVVFDPSARLVRYEHAVHELPEDVGEHHEPPQRSTAILAYRDADHDVRFHDMTPLAAAIFERLLGGETLRAAVVGACEALAQPLTPQVLQGTAELLATLAERGAIRGAT